MTENIRVMQNMKASVKYSRYYETSIAAADLFYF